jgi:hypothetical protein
VSFRQRCRFDENPWLAIMAAHKDANIANRGHAPVCQPMAFLMIHLPDFVDGSG